MDGWVFLLYFSYSMILHFLISWVYQEIWGDSLERTMQRIWKIEEAKGDSKQDKNLEQILGTENQELISQHKFGE